MKREYVAWHVRTKDDMWITTPVTFKELRAMLMDKVRDIPIEHWNREARDRFLQQLLGKATPVLSLYTRGTQYGVPIGEQCFLWGEVKVRNVKCHLRPDDDCYLAARV